ncbi:MAG: hypothetical protein ACE5E1_04310 [Phycisphaerae bacterium]
MFHPVARSVLVLSLLTALSPVLAGPGDLLKQAIEENDAQPVPKGDQVHKLVSEADRLADQRAFNKAIALYEKAYRLEPANQGTYARLLAAKRAAGVMTEQDRRALELIQEQQAAEIDQAFRSVRLALIQARQALRSGDPDLAEVRLASAKRTLDRLPPFVDVAPYRRQLANLRKAAKRRGASKRARVEALGGATIGITRPVKPSTDGKALTLTETEDPSDTEAEANVETGEIINVNEVLDKNQERHAYDRELTAALRRARSGVFLSNNEAAFPPADDMTFPDDWAERTQRRAKYRDGLIYRSKPFTGEDGKEYYTAIYDIGDLVHPVPNFYASYPGSVRQQRLESRDRFWLNYRSQIFGGYADDLAAGLPLLHFFGGVDNNAVSTRTDPREVERVIRTIERFIKSP